MKDAYVAITGRLPELSLAELEAVFGSQIRKLSTDAVLIPGKVSESDYARLGGSLKVGRLLSKAPCDFGAVESHLKANIQDFLPKSGKIQLGLSVYGLKVNSQRIQKLLLTLKRQLKNNGRSARVIIGKSNPLSTAEVYHNKLTGPLGCEIIVIGDGESAFIAKTEFVQDINSYVQRDRGRPMRDARVGMLPPKLAQTIINLSIGQIDTNNERGMMNERKIRVLDPFCGTGVLLQEAMLLGFSVYGTDLEPRMIDFTTKNLEWLSSAFNFKAPSFYVEQGDATIHKWDLSTLSPTPYALTIACETYLGPPLTRQIPEPELKKMIASVNKLHEAFLKNIGSQIKAGTRLCLAVPAWRRQNGLLHLPVLEKLSSLGYNWVEFKHVDSKKLIYDREDQFVARQLVTLIKK